MALLHSPVVQAGIGGFLAALVVDLHAYSEAPEGASFNWMKAGARWVSGAITSALAVAGLGQIA